MSEKIIISLMRENNPEPVVVVDDDDDVVFKSAKRSVLHRNSKTIRGEDSDQPLTRCCSPGIRRWSAPVKKEKREKERGRNPATTKVKTRQLSGLLRTSPLSMRMTTARVSLEVRPEDKTRGETPTPWSPDTPAARSFAQRLGWVRLCADYHLPPPLASPIISQSITAGRRQQHTGRLDWQQRHTFALIYTVKMCFYYKVF